MTHELRIKGHIPSKKNNLRPTTHGKFMNDPVIAADISALGWQARSQWVGKKPIERASVSAVFYVLDGRSDLDNKWVTLSDVLVSVGVLRNDSIARLRSIRLEAVVSDQELVIVTLAEAA